MTSAADSPDQALAPPDSDPDSDPGSGPGPDQGDDRRRFRSILFDGVDGGTASGGGVDLDRDQPEAPAFFADLRLDQVLKAMTAGRDEYNLKPFFYLPLREVAAVRYRHEVLRDLETPAVSEPIGAFAQRMRTMRQQLTRARKLHCPRQRQRWFLDAVATYTDTVTALAAALTPLTVTSRGLQAFLGYLTTYVASDPSTSLVRETQALTDALAGVRYRLHLDGTRVKVSPYDGEADYSAEVAAVFAKFKQGAVTDHRVALPDLPDMNHVEARVLDLVARLHPDVFATLDAYSARHAGYLDPTIGTFDREVQFYLAYLDYIGRLKPAGLPFCYPQISTRSKQIAVHEGFDLALATKLVGDRTPVVRNDVQLSGPERILVVTGPNQGGKTTFARMVGQLHYLASLGLPVPARTARLFLPDRLFTHFEREEDLATLRGKLDDELVRIHAILQQATSSSLVIMNESFTSTTLNDALLLGTAVLNQLIALGALGVCVTFVDELASLDQATVSMVATVPAGDPAGRTYQLVRRPADGLAYAAALADKHGLTYHTLRHRITGRGSGR